MKPGQFSIRNGVLKALEWFDIKYQVEETPAAGELCNGFEKKARRVPRNICADPIVEAKRAVSECHRSGFSSLRKSILNCLVESNSCYQAEYLSSLQSYCREYLGLYLKLSHKSSESIEYLVFDFYKEEIPYWLQFVVECNSDNEGLPVFAFFLVSNITGTIRPANDLDFECLMAKE